MLIKNKILLLGITIIFCVCTISCTEKVAEIPIPVSNVPIPIEPKYLEWSYEPGKDPLLIQIFSFPTGLNPAIYFNISDTTKIQNIFEGSVSGNDYFGKVQNLDMTKNSWNAQIFPNVPVKVGGYEFSEKIRDELFKGLMFTNEKGKGILEWAASNLPKIYNEKLKPQLEIKNNDYFRIYKKKPKYQVAVLVVPSDYNESNLGGTIITMSDGNKIVFSIEPLREPGKLEKYLSMYIKLGHEFAGHGLTGNKNTFNNFVGQKDQFGNIIDGYGHINSTVAPHNMFRGSVGTHIRIDDSNNSMLFPQEDKEFLSAYKVGSLSDGSAEHKANYGNLKLMKTPLEKSNIPYISNIVKNSQIEGEKFMKEMWTDKILVTKGGRVSAKEDNITIKSIISCH